jgi:CBS domain-containing protein
VVEDGRLVGILTETDVLNAYLSLGDVSEMAPQPCWMADAARY